MFTTSAARRVGVLVIIALLFGVRPPAARAADASRDGHGTKPPKICLVLSGGGARGAAHVGVLRVLEEMHIPISCIAGTSAGGAIGGLYAAGLSPDAIAEFLDEMDWEKALADRPARIDRSFRRKQDDSRYLVGLELGYANGHFYLPKGFIAGENLDFVLKSRLLSAAGIHDFDKLPIPFRAVATDMTSGEKVVLGRGDLATALRASMAVPGVFSPVEVDGRTLADGGLVDNLPVDVARAMGADVVIAVDVGTPLSKRNQLGNVLGLSLQVINIMTHQNVERSKASLKSGDVLVEPDLASVDAASFDQVERAMSAGAAATRAHADALRQYSVSPSRYWEFLQQQRNGRDHLPVVDYIAIRGNRAVSDQRIRAQIRSEVGKPLNLDVLGRDLERIYEIGEFERVTFRIEDRLNAKGLVIDVREKTWGPHELRFGMTMRDDFEGGSDYSLSFADTRTNLNTFGGEWKNEITVGQPRRLYSEFFQPLDYAGNVFVAPNVEYRGRTYDLFQDNIRTSEFVAKTARLNLDAGYILGDVGELRIGLSRGVATVGPRIGPTNLPTEHYDLGGYHVSATLDTRDRPYFARYGLYARFEDSVSRPAFGASQSYNRIQARASWATSFGDQTLVFAGEYGTASGAAMPAYDQFTLGGFLSLSGYRDDQLRGSEYIALRTILYSRIYELPSVLGDALYLGGSLESGNVWADGSRASFGELKTGASAFVGADSVLGPVYLGAGLTESGNRAFYLSLGYTFH